MVWQTWGHVYQHYLDKGCDHADAAYRADEWEKRKERKDALDARKSDQQR